MPIPLAQLYYGYADYSTKLRNCHPEAFFAEGSVTAESVKL